MDRESAPTLPPEAPGPAGPDPQHPSPWAGQPLYGPLAPHATGPDREKGHRDRTGQSWFRRRIAPIGAAIVALAVKLKSLLLLLPKLKLLSTAGTMLVSIVAYTTIWGLSFAAGFVILLLVHELGHVIALRREGIPASWPMFIPFLGAVITSRSLGDDAAAEARVGLAGPVLGSAGAAVCILIWQATGHDYWRALAFTGLFLNLFNLLPVVPLDGGRAMAAMAPWVWGVGVVAIIALALLFPNPIILIIAVVAAFETYRRYQERRHGDAATAAYYRVRPRDRWLTAAVYFGLIALLVVGMDATHLPRTLG